MCRFDGSCGDFAGCLPCRFIGALCAARDSIFVVDPGNPDVSSVRNPLTIIRKSAVDGLPELALLLRQKYL